MMSGRQRIDKQVVVIVYKLHVDQPQSSSLPNNKRYWCCKSNAPASCPWKKYYKGHWDTLSCVTPPCICHTLYITACNKISLMPSPSIFLAYSMWSRIGWWQLKVWKRGYWFLVWTSHANCYTFSSSILTETESSNSSDYLYTFIGKLSTFYCGMLKAGKRC